MIGHLFKEVSIGIPTNQLLICPVCVIGDRICGSVLYLIKLSRLDPVDNLADRLLLAIPTSASVIRSQQRPTLIIIIDAGALAVLITAAIARD